MFDYEKLDLGDVFVMYYPAQRKLRETEGYVEDDRFAPGKFENIDLNFADMYIAFDGVKFELKKYEDRGHFYSVCFKVPENNNKYSTLWASIFVE